MPDIVVSENVTGPAITELKAVTEQYLGRSFRRDDGTELRIGKCLIDANGGTSTDVVYHFCRQSPYSSVLVPSHGPFVGASSKPFFEYQQSPGEKPGHNWFVPNLTGKRKVRHVLFDTNYCAGPAQSGDRRSGMPVAVWESARDASAIFGTSDGGIPRAD